ncbi:MAG: MBOAT family protein [Spirochaetales bacterium]|nr:MBOAT family protein [Spirochaetales bacterium]
MLFVTESFLIFFLAVLCGFWIVQATWRRNILIVASLFFYATWSVPFTFHFIFIIALNYLVMELWREYRKVYLFYGLQILNICNIAFFKYYYLVFDFLGRLLSVPSFLEAGLRETHRSAGMEIFLPLAISFYTFQVMGYGIDLYRGTYTEKHSFLDVLLFLMFFPQLIAGPIMRSADLLPQLTQTHKIGWNSEEFKRGLWLILAGVFKKLLIADQLLAGAAPVLGASPATLPEFATWTLWSAILSAMLMLYADFSAYSDIACGTAAMLGFKLPVNFKAPFFLVSFSDFWRRWHLTFSYWIRDYIYIPLGGSKAGELRNYFNLVVTFFLGGLWHGASYTFVLWGILMGVVLSAEAILRRQGIADWPQQYWLRAIRLAIVWILLILSSVFFFSPSLQWSFDCMQWMLTGTEGKLLPAQGMVLPVAAFCVLFFHFVEEKPEWFTRFRRHENLLLPLVSLLLLLLVHEYVQGAKDFFYFQF